MSAFDGLAETISVLIEEEGLGIPVTLTWVTTGAYDNATLKATTTETNADAIAIVETCKRELKQGVGVAAGDLVISIPAPQLEAEPVERGLVTLAGKAYTTVAVATVYAGAEPVLYQLQARRG